MILDTDRILMEVLADPSFANSLDFHVHYYSRVHSIDSKSFNICYETDDAIQIGERIIRPTEYVNCNIIWITIMKHNGLYYISFDAKSSFKKSNLSESDFVTLIKNIYYFDKNCEKISPQYCLSQIEE